MGRLEGQVAVVTGGNSGIGLSTAKEFREQGAKVAILGRNPETLAKAAAEVGEGTVAVQGDVSNLADIDKLYAETTAQLGKIDILVANAGVGIPRPFEQTDEKHFDMHFDINVKGTYFTIQKALPHLNDGASVVIVGSVVSGKGLEGFSAYSATKAALRNLARTLAVELKPRGIRVNVLSPGPIMTPIYDRMGLPEEQAKEFGQFIEQGVPLGRFGQPDEIAKAALFLASPDSSYVTGSDLQADGGFAQI